MASKYVHIMVKAFGRLRGGAHMAVLLHITRSGMQLT
jgi:hypothetical protein